MNEHKKRRRSRTAYTAILLIAACGVVYAKDDSPAIPDAASDPVKRLAENSMRQGLDGMKGVQKEDGSWSSPNFPALSALGLWAFARSTHPDRGAVRTKVAAFIAGFVQEDGGIYRKAGLGRRSGGLSTALDWAARHWSVDENPGMGTRGLFYYYNIMGKALSLSGSDTLKTPSGKTIQWKEQIVERLAARQRWSRPTQC